MTSALDAERLERVERSLASLWEQVKSSGGEQNARHAQVLGLCNSLKDELHENTDRERMSEWLNTLLEERIILMRNQLERERGEDQDEDQGEDQDHRNLQVQNSRLEKLEALLQELALKTEVNKVAALMLLNRFITTDIIINGFSAGVPQAPGDSCLPPVCKVSPSHQ